MAARNDSGLGTNNRTRINLDQIQAKLLADSLQGRIVGGWTIDGFFGNGKSAIVLPALREGREAAIKVFHPELVERYGKDAQLERILREKSLVGSEHPNLVRIFDGGECPATNHLYVVMECLPYKNLHQLLGKVPLEAVPRLISQVASAARFLEDRGLAHRDIKPENIAITPDWSRAILMDLGVIRPIGASNLTDIDQRLFIGTLRYSSPEFLLRKEEDSVEGWRAVTFYQLGAVLHDMLMGHVLFEEHTEPFSQLVEAVKAVVPTIYSADARSVTLANHCLIKNPTTRRELVDWSRFSDSPTEDSSNVTAARDRIRQRQKYFREAAKPGELKASGEERRLIQQILEDLCNRFESRIAALMNDLQCFPLRATRSVKDPEHRCCTTCVQFEPDYVMGLPHHLSMKFEVSIVDPNNGVPICKACVVSVLSRCEVAVADVGEEVKQFFVGEIQEFLDSALLQQQFLNSLEAAYRSEEQGQSPPENGVLRLTIG